MRTIVLPGLTGYHEAWDLQRRIHAAVAAEREPDTLLLLQHEAVFTAGQRTEPHERPIDGTPVVEVDRGGKITWHGPGQLVGYPIVRLTRPVSVRGYVELVEDALMAAVAELGVATTKVPGRTGVWVAADHRGPERKLAALGVRVAQFTTMHGFALNVCCDLSWAGAIVPCGIPDAGVTSLSQELARAITVDEVTPLVERHLVAAWTAHVRDREGADRVLPAPHLEVVTT